MTGSAKQSIVPGKERMDGFVADQQWLLRGNSSPPFKIGGPGCGEGCAGERKSLA